MTLQSLVDVASVEDWVHLMPHELLVELPDGTFDETGQANYKAGITYKAYVEDAIEKVRDVSGTDRVSSRFIIVATIIAIDPLARITLPSTKPPTQPSIIKSDLVDGPTGPHHVEMFV